MDNDRPSSQQNLISDDMGDPEVPTTKGSQNAPQNESTQSSSLTLRRPDIDILIIVMTWLTLVFNATLVYCPDSPEWLYYVKDPNAPNTAGPESASFYYWVFLHFMNAWNMPIFFFIAGVNSYLSLFRREERDYTKERFHRLLVPTLFLMCVTQAILSLSYFAPMSSACLSHYHHNATNSTPDCLTWWGEIKSSSNFPTSFVQKLVKMYLKLSHSQVFLLNWFCMYLFLYSKILAFNFNNWHSKHGDEGNPGKFNKAIQKLLMGPIKLMLIPSILIALIELLFRAVYGNHPGEEWIDWCNHMHYFGVFFLGYAIMAGDNRGFNDILKKCRWWYLFIGTLFLSLYVTVTLIGEILFANFNPEVTSYMYPICVYIIRCILRGFGEWPFILGLYAVNRTICTRNFKIIKILREMAMPFFLLHQQVLVGITSGTLWVPYLGSFIGTIMLTTLSTCGIAFLIAKSPGPIRYLFGLPSKHKLVPDEKFNGYGPFIVLFLIAFIECTAANIINAILI